MASTKPLPISGPVVGDEPGSSEEPVLRLGVSSCLLGEEVRFDGGHKRDRFLLASLGPYVKWFPICPELEMGLGVPRESLRLTGKVASPRLTAPRSGADHTEAMQDWSRERLEQLVDLDLHGYVLKRASPSCGLFRVKVYGKNNIPQHDGRGIYAAELMDRFPLLPVEEEGRLHDAHLRENFIERLFAHERWKRFLREDPTPAGLVQFHTGQKLTLMAHSPAHYRNLGRLVADLRRQPFESLLQDYKSGFFEGLGKIASRGRHVNVLQHVLGFLKQKLPAEHKAEMTELIEDYRHGLVPLVVPVTLLRHHLRFHDVDPWILQQSYLRPYPKELMLRNHV